MGSLIEINDTLKIQEGLINEPFQEGLTYNFELLDRRLYHLHPIRVFFVIEREKKWDYIGHALILSQEIDAIKNITKGTFVIDKLYNTEYKKLVNEQESPKGRGFKI